MTQSGLVIDRGRPDIGAAASVASPARVEVGERDLRNALRRQIARLERESSAIVAGSFPYISLADLPDLGREQSPAAPACSRWRSWSGYATTWPAEHRTCAGSRRARRARASCARAAGRDEARTGPLQVRAFAGAGPWRRGMWGVGGASATRADRDAGRMVASQALLRLSLGTGVTRTRDPGGGWVYRSWGPRAHARPRGGWVLIDQ